MTNAKDTFYIVLRDRLAALNPARTVVVRGITRPGVLVQENELVSSETAADVFVLQWTGLKIDVLGTRPLASITCEVHYATAGSAVNGGMDRGRLLAAMDAELSNALRAVPHNTLKMNYALSNAAQGPAAMATNVFWSDATYGAVKASGELLQRVATVEVFSYEEAGE